MQKQDFHVELDNGILAIASEKTDKQKLDLGRHEKCYELDLILGCFFIVVNILAWFLVR